MHTIIRDIIHMIIHVHFGGIIACLLDKSQHHIGDRSQTIPTFSNPKQFPGIVEGCVIP